MKKFLTNLLLLCFLPMVAQAQFNVTFQVDMTGKTVSPNGVRIAGSFQGWNPATTPLTHQGNNIYSVTLNVSPGTHEYKFINGNTWSAPSEPENVSGSCGVAPNGNRKVIVTGIATLPLVCFNKCTACPTQNYNVTFQVDMTGRTVSPQGMFIAGTFNNWNSTANPLTNQGNNIYAATISVPNEEIMYKFLNGTTWENITSTSCTVGSSKNRYALITGPTVLNADCFNQCGSCAGSTAFNVTFQVDMTGKTVNVNGVHVAGNFNSWDPSANKMTHQGNNIYSVTVPNISSGPIEYKFVNGNAWPPGGEDETIPAACQAPGTNNRGANITSNSTLPLVCFGSCVACPQTVNVTFQVDMTGKTVSPNGVHVGGNFNGWTANATPMAHQGNNIYSVTTAVPVGVLEYKFINGNAWPPNGEDETVPTACVFPGTNNRGANISTATTLPLICFNECNPCIPKIYSVTFKVDMTGKTVSPNGVHVGGNFNNWTANATPMTNNGNGIWSVTVPNLGGNIEYKFINGNDWAPNGEDETIPAACQFAGSSNRGIKITANTNLTTVCFNECGPCALSLSAIGQKNVSCKGGTDGEVTVNVIGGSGCVPSYLWSNGSTSASIASLSANQYTVTVTCGSQTSTFSVNITEPTQLALSNPTSTILSCYADATASLNVNGGTSPYNYLWSNGVTTAQSVFFTTGTHQVTVTDAKGCKANSDITINGNKQAPIIQITNANPSVGCKIPTLQLNVNANGFSNNLNYKWVGPGIASGDNTATPTINKGGYYSVSVTDIGNGCSNSTAINVVEDFIAPTFSINGKKEICNGDSTNLEVNTDFPAYLWSTGATTQSIVVKSIATYKVTVTAKNGCQKEENIIIVASPQPMVTLLSDTLKCSKPSLTLKATTSSNLQSIIWSGPNNFTASTLTPNITVAGKYSLFATTDKGCSQTYSIDIYADNAVPNVSIIGKDSLCKDETTKLTATPGFNSYLWTNGSTSNSISTNQLGSYNVTITTASGCQTVASYTVVAAPMPTLSLIDEVKACEGLTYALITNTSKGLSFNWKGANNFTSSDSIPVITALKLSDAGKYFLTVTNSNGCNINDSTEVKVSPKMTLNLTSSMDCADNALLNSTVSGGISPYTYAWNTNKDSTATTMVKAPALVIVTVTDAYGCKISNSPALTITPIVPMTFSINLKNITETSSGSLILSVKNGVNPYSYLWSNGATTKDLMNIKDPGKYCITVTDANGCVKEACYDISKIVGAEDVYLAQKITLSPNPTNIDVINIQIEDDKIVINNIELIDATGRVIASYEGIQRQISVAEITQGIYFVKLNSKEGAVVKRVVVLKQ